MRAVGKAALALFFLSVFLAPAAGAFSAGPAASGSAGASGAERVSAVVVRLDDIIGPALESYLERALREGEEAGADRAIIVINTFGGTLDAAVAIGETLQNSGLKTVAYVEGKAISAGTYIALSADEIYMQKGATIGSAAIVDAAGERVRDSKVVSAWVELMRGAAQRNGRNPDIAAGMVDDTIRVEMPELGRTNEPGNLIALTADDALAVGYAEGVVENLAELLRLLGAEDARLIEPKLAEQAARFLTHPAVQTVLLVVGVAGLLLELLMPGTHVPGIVGAAAFALYFLGNYMAGFAGVEHMVLFVAGLVLMFLELLTPTFGILGVLGIIALVAGVLLAAQDTGDAARSLGIAFLIALAVVLVAARFFKHLGVWNKFILKDAMKTEEGYVSHVSRTDLLGKRGRALTPLRPSGTALIGEQRVDVVSEGEFIPKDADIVVVLVDGGRVVVRRAAANP